MRFLPSEYVTGKTHGGRIDTLGLDDNNCPVIIEYKRALNENVVSQGLLYLDWLMDHQGEFTLQVMKKLGSECSERIDSSGPRLLCIAGDFTRYDEYAVLQIPRNIELLRYRRYGGDLLLLELVCAGATIPHRRRCDPKEADKKQSHAAASEESGEATTLQDVWESLKAFLLALGDDVQMKELEHYVAFRRLKNFACVRLRSKDLLVWAKLDPEWHAYRDCGITLRTVRQAHYFEIDERRLAVVLFVFVTFALAVACFGLMLCGNCRNGRCRTKRYGRPFLPNSVGIAPGVPEFRWRPRLLRPLLTKTIASRPPSAHI